MSRVRPVCDLSKRALFLASWHSSSGHVKSLFLTDNRKHHQTVTTVTNSITDNHLKKHGNFLQYYGTTWKMQNDRPHCGTICNEYEISTTGSVWTCCPIQRLCSRLTALWRFVNFILLLLLLFSQRFLRLRFFQLLALQVTTLHLNLVEWCWSG